MPKVASQPLAETLDALTRALTPTAVTPLPEGEGPEVKVCPSIPYISIR